MARLHVACLLWAWAGLTACPAEDLAEGVLIRFEPLSKDAVVGRGAVPRQAVEIRRAELVQTLARARLQRDASLEASPLPPELRQQVVDRLIDQRLLAAEAQALGLTVTSSTVGRELAALQAGLPEDQFRKHLIRTYQTIDMLRHHIESRLMAGQLLAQVEPSPVTEADARAAFDALSLEQRVVPPRVRATQIQAATEEEGRELLKELEAGASFEDVAWRMDPENGGRLGWFSKGEMPSIFEETCFALEPGARSGLIPSQYGHHIFKVYERKDRRVREFHEMRSELEEVLRQERLRQREAALMRQLRQAYEMQVDEEALRNLLEGGAP